MESIHKAWNERASAGNFQRIVVLEKGPLSSRLDLVCGRDQRLFSQTQEETVDEFSTRVVGRLHPGSLIDQATVLLGGAGTVQPRHELCRSLCRSFKNGAHGLLEVLARTGTQAADTAWQLFEQLIRDEELRGVQFRLRLIE
jgi:hypothetical protein